jgi:predicted GNAT family acetyltransferase
VDLTTFPSAADFLAAVEPALAEAEAVHSLIYGLALTLERFPERYQKSPYRWPPFFASVSGSSGLALVALQTPPLNLLLSSLRPGGSAACGMLAQTLQAGEEQIPGVLGPSEPALAFAEAWVREAGVSFQLGTSERLFELRQVIPPPQPPGAMRQAMMKDAELVARWIFAFHLEAMPRDAGTLEQARGLAESLITAGNFFLWEDGDPAAIAAKSRPTPHGCSIGPVYTPPERRSHGYATALTAALSQRLLDSGKRFTALFTDLANPISNSIYQKIGYRPVCNFSEYIFS